MKVIKFIIAIFVFSFSLYSCETTIKKKDDTSKQVLATAKIESVSLHVSGMTCEIGCAKTIESKLSKKEGIAKAKVVFIDSLATVNFDSNQVSKEEIISFINGIAGGDLYQASEVSLQE